MEPSHLEGYPVCVFDWAGRKDVFWTVDGITAQHSTNLMMMLEYLDEPYRIVGEPMFESFGTHNARDAFVKECRELGHVLQRVSSRQTFWFRERNHVDASHEIVKVKDCKEEMCAKTDELDVMRIWELAHTVHCSSVELHSDSTEVEFKRRLNKLNDEAMVLRKSGMKDELMASITEAVPVNSLPKNLYDSLTTGTKKDRTYRCGVPSIWLAAREAKNRDEFERFLGLHGNGASCQLRSDMYFWIWQYLRNAAIKAGEDVQKRRSSFRNDVRTFRHMLLANPPKIGGLEDLE